MAALVTKARRPDAYKLLHEGALTLAQIEANGIRIDEDYLEAALHSTSSRMDSLEKKLLSSKFFRKWRKLFGEKAKLGNRQQLGHILFNRLGYKCTQWTEPTERHPKGLPKVDETTLANIDSPFVKDYLQWTKLQKVKSVYLLGIKREVLDGYLHPFFNLHTVETYRGSCDHPNFQNMPVRNPEIAELIRKCFIPRDGYQLVEIDFSGIEVRIAAAYHKDPTMLSYLLDPSKDMHRDMAAECFLLSKKQVSKMARYCAKNMFVFPQFYGSYYVDCARNLWEALTKHDLRIEGSSKSVMDWLLKKGIKELGACDPEKKPRRGTFEYHIREVETAFWDKRFPVYKQWKIDWYNRYRRLGYFDTLTGFRIHGLYNRNQVINYPVQGCAFHCLLWCLIRIQRWLTKNKMKTKLIGQIHDSIIADVAVGEKDQYLAKVKHITTTALPRAWKWINVPMLVEAEVAPPGASWFEKKAITL